MGALEGDATSRARSARIGGGERLAVEKHGHADRPFSVAAQESRDEGGAGLGDGRQRIAALLHDQRRQAKARDDLADARERLAVTASFEARIVAVRVPAGRDDERIRAEGPDRVGQPLHRRQERRVVRARRQHDVEVRALALAMAALVGVAGEEGVVVGRVGMAGGDENVAAPVEDGLRAVAVMGVEIEDGDAREARAQALGGDGALFRKQKPLALSR